MRMMSLKFPSFHWCLQAGTAQTWVAPSAGRLCVVRGRVWASCDALRAPATDHILQAGDGVVMFAGQRVVLEPWARDAHDEAWLRWMSS
jgi:hypothetical protein